MRPTPAHLRATAGPTSAPLLCPRSAAESDRVSFVCGIGTSFRAARRTSSFQRTLASCRGSQAQLWWGGEPPQARRAEQARRAAAAVGGGAACSRTGR